VVAVSEPVAVLRGKRLKCMVNTDVLVEGERVGVDTLFDTGSFDDSFIHPRVVERLGMQGLVQPGVFEWGMAAELEESGGAPKATMKGSGKIELELEWAGGKVRRKLVLFVARVAVDMLIGWEDLGRIGAAVDARKDHVVFMGEGDEEMLGVEKLLAGRQVRGVAVCSENVRAVRLA
jgi:hypothetical protein